MKISDILKNPNILVCKMEPHREDQNSIYFLLDLSLFLHFSSTVDIMTQKGKILEYQGFLCLQCPWISAYILMW